MMISSANSSKTTVASRHQKRLVFRKSATTQHSPLGGYVKRAVDVILSVIFIAVFSPLLLGLALMIKFQDQGDIFYGHPRIGFGGRSFRCWKFRTMAQNGDWILEQHFAEHPEDRKIWERDRKLPNDPRVTPLGQTLRKMSLDELPQILNVLLGDMSLVGPRPVVQDELQKYSRTVSRYLKSRPGLTGLWQVSGRSDTGYDHRVKLDRYYVSQWSLALDLIILIRTVPAVLSSRGAR